MPDRRILARRSGWALSCLALLLAAACGKDEGGLDRSRYDDVYRAAMQAIADRDLGALWPLLTPQGRDKVERDLRDWQERLRDPEQGAYILDQVRRRLPDVTDGEIERARYGTIRDAWEFFLRADPRPASPPSRGLRVAPDGKTVHLDYADPTGTQRTVRLRQLPAGWFVDDLQL
jgi:hypothetical protein